MVIESEIVFIALIFMFVGFMGYLNYKVEMNLINKGLYKRMYNRVGDIKIGLMLIAIGVATGVALHYTNELFTKANLGFFIPLFTGVTLIISTFVGEDSVDQKKKKSKA